QPTVRLALSGQVRGKYGKQFRYSRLVQLSLGGLEIQVRVGGAPGQQPFERVQHGGLAAAWAALEQQDGPPGRESVGVDTRSEHFRPQQLDRAGSAVESDHHDVPPGQCWRSGPSVSTYWRRGS